MQPARGLLPVSAPQRRPAHRAASYTVRETSWSAAASPIPPTLDLNLIAGRSAAAMGRRRTKRDWYNFHRSYFKPDSGVAGGGASSCSPAPAPPQAPATQAPAALDAVIAPSGDERRRGLSPGRHGTFEEPRGELDRCFGPGAQVEHFHLNPAAAVKTAVGRGPDIHSASKGADDSSPVDEDEQVEHGKSSPKFSEPKKNDGQVCTNHGNGKECRMLPDLIQPNRS